MTAHMQFKFFVLALERGLLLRIFGDAYEGLHFQWN